MTKEPAYRAPTEHAKVNQFAIRCFRETGDLDYIAARLSIRSGLYAPFLWSASQAVEKYLKGILMLNRIKTGDLGHDLAKALQRINQKLPFRISLEPGEQEVFDHLARWHGDRYLLASITVDNYELFPFDALVWRLRQYCQTLDKDHYADEPSESVLQRKVTEIEAVLQGGSRLAGHLPGGVLEGILAKRDHRAHDALVWQNMFYSRTERKSIRYRTGWQAVNAPLFLNPELVDVVAQWMHIPEPIKVAARQFAASKQSKKAKK